MRRLPTAHTKKAQARFDAWSATIDAYNLHVGQLVTVTRAITDGRDVIIHKWEEPAVVTEIRNFDAVVKFQDGTTSSSGLGLRAFELPTI